MINRGKVITLGDFASMLSSQGTRVVPGSKETFWIRSEFTVLARIPDFLMAPPDPGEVEQVLKEGWAAVASYYLEPEENHPPNAWLYLCTDRTYSIERLSPPMRRNVRRGLKELRIAQLSPDQLFIHGMQAFCDTRKRVGLSDGTPENFQRRFSQRAKCPAHVFLGAWKDDTLAAFLSITEVDDWASIEGCFSRTDLLNSRPNDLLMYTTLSRYLIDEGRRVVGYGASSVQSESNAATLHVFKKKVGFQAKPVHRAFVFHPLLRPFVGRATLGMIGLLLHMRPGSPWLKKAEGVLRCIAVEKRRSS